MCGIPLAIDFAKPYSDRFDETDTESSENERIETLRNRPSFLFVHPLLYTFFVGDTKVNTINALTRIIDLLTYPQHGAGPLSQATELVQFIWTAENGFHETREPQTKKHPNPTNWRLYSRSRPPISNVPNRKESTDGNTPSSTSDPKRRKKRMTEKSPQPARRKKKRMTKKSPPPTRRRGGQRREQKGDLQNQTGETEEGRGG